MNASAAAMDAYRRVGVESKVSAASPHKLISLLFEGAIGALSKAIYFYEANDMQQRLQAVSKANAIVLEGLMASVDTSTGADLAGKLVSLYQYVSHLLLTSNVENRKEPLEEAKGLLVEIFDAWKGIGKSDS